MANACLYHAFQEDERWFLWSGYRLQAWEVEPSLAAYFVLGLSGKPRGAAQRALQNAGFAEEESLRSYRIAMDLQRDDWEAFPESADPAYYTRPVTLSPGYRTATVSVAGACNLRCPYCWNAGGAYDQQRPALMSAATARATAAFLLAHCGESLQIRFYGGEPLLNYPVVRQLTLDLEEAAANRGIPVSFGISTNATLLGDGVCTFLREHRFDVGISIDGSPDVMALQRPTRSGANSYPAVVAGLKAAHRAGLAVVVRLTLTARVAASWMEQVAHVMNLGVPIESVQVDFVNKAGPFGSPDLAVPVEARKAALDDYQNS